MGAPRAPPLCFSLPGGRERDTQRETEFIGHDIATATATSTSTALVAPPPPRLCPLQTEHRGGGKKPTLHMRAAVVQVGYDVLGRGDVRFYAGRDVQRPHAKCF